MLLPRALLIASVLYSAVLHAAEDGDRPATFRVVKDLVHDFDEAVVSDALEASASSAELAGGVAHPGIFLHPRNRRDAVVEWRRVTLPSASAEQSLFLLFRAAIRDGVPWEKGIANGVRFEVRVDGSRVFTEDVRGQGWRARAVNLDRWAGETVRLSLVTNAIDGNTNYDWASFGQTLIVLLARGLALEGDAGARASISRVGAALAEVRCASPARVALRCGTDVDVRDLGVGRHTLVHWFATLEGAGVEVRSGDVVIERFRAGAFRPQVVVDELALSTPLITTDRPFAAIAHLRNEGLGDTTAEDRVAWRLALPDGATRTAELAVGRLAPGERRTLSWRDLRAPKPGRAELTVTGAHELRFEVFRAEPELPATRFAGAAVRREDGGLEGRVETDRCRLTVLVDVDGRARAVVETWSGRRWRRVGSLYPLAELVLESEGRRHRTNLVVDDLRATGERLDIIARARSEAVASPWPVEVTLAATADAARFVWSAAVTAPSAGGVRLFAGPRVLVGDRASGAGKRAALFPGLEYLEGDEPSSSDRDLAWPLSDRRVPAVHEPTIPLMAVETERALVALAWKPGARWSPAAGARHYAARFASPSVASGYEHAHLSLSVPPVGERRARNTYEAQRAFELAAGDELRIEATLILDDAARPRPARIARGPLGGGRVLEAVRDWIELNGLPPPSPAPRSWEEERELCRDAYLGVLWEDTPPGWRHVAQWPAQALVGHAVPLLLDVRAGVPGDVRRSIEDRVARITARAGRARLWSNAGCHIALGELPYLYGGVVESLAAFRDHARRLLAARREGLWRWYPGGERHATLGPAGGHVLGSAASPAFVSLRAARLCGDPTLAATALAAARQLERYEVPRGAQMWECPLLQPDILAAAYAIRAHCEAYRLTADARHLERARYWAWTGLPFLYLWELEGYPTMRYNVISVFGSTFHSHSWIGLPVVWCGLVYGYALQDLAELDDSFQWRTVAAGIVRSAMWQQYTEGRSRGCYPDSWSMVENEPRPADINPENILLNEFRLRGLSPEMDSRRVPAGGVVAMLNSSARITACDGDADRGELTCSLQGTPGFPAWTTLAPVSEPSDVDGAGARVDRSEALDASAGGWMYDAGLRAVVVKHVATAAPARLEVRWKGRGR